MLRPGGPVRAPLRECCVAALIGAPAPAAACRATVVRAAPARSARSCDGPPAVVVPRAEAA
ncbi:hypothetical protein [Actinoplanes siamensis]|uniref:Uncharacterized protein n=1 Tax=Actinoplanes siamensis TaxID=1223317 RepID=A0A919N6L0_9ACTN|nr:hypothetical protein [Actinoplanes siamensis]GIF05295.1 hypothetical protein Asi03nite_28330 [Actinoplanes siamensis]